jgi:hypothetical protein
VPDDLLLVAPPHILELLRAALRPDGWNTKTRRHEEEVEWGSTGNMSQDSVEPAG